MARYLDILPKKCINKEEGIARAVIIEDMLKHETMFAQLEQTGEGVTKSYLKDSVEDILEVLYESNAPMAIWNKTLEDKAGLFQFDSNNQKMVMLFPMETPGFKQSFLENVVSVKGGEKMAKKCPRTGDYVLYLDCKECENRAECEAK